MTGEAFVIPEYTVKEFVPETWPDFEALFGKHKGVRGGCWCAFNRCATTYQFDKMAKDERRAFQRELALSGRGCGLLVYDQGTPIAWCQFGQAGDFPRIDRMRAYQALDLPAPREPLWRITCLFVDKHRRREGWSQVALRAALDRIRQRGGGTVEAFPFEVPGVARPSYTGSVSMYAQEGFQEVARLGSVTVLVRHFIPASE